MEFSNNMRLSDLDTISHDIQLWGHYWAFYNEPFEPWHPGQSVARMRKLKKHQIELRGAERFVKWYMSDPLLPQQIELMLGNSKLWYAYVEKHSYFKPQSFAKLDYNEKKALILNHQQMLKRGINFQGEDTMHKTEQEIAELNGYQATGELIKKGEFAMIYVEGASTPTKMHFSEESVNTEADRLARDTKKRVFILRPVEVREVELAPVKSTSLVDRVDNTIGGDPIKMDSQL